MNLYNLKEKKNLLIQLFKSPIKKIIANNSFWYAIGKVIVRRNDLEFLSSIKDEPNIFYLKNNKNQGNGIFYHIYIDESSQGLMGSLRWIIESLYWCEELKLTPYIEFSNRMPYFEKSGFMDTDNSFEYYFKQYSSNNIKDATFIIKMNPYHLQSAHRYMNGNVDSISIYDFNDDYIKYASELVNKYLSFNDITKEFIYKSVNSFVVSLKETKVLGVHIRGTDFKLQWNGHPNVVEPSEYFSLIDDIIFNYEYKYVFLATDDLDYLREFKSKYNEKLLYYADTHRGDGDINISLIDGVRENNKYKNGLEVIRDAFTLAQCDGLVAGLSNVATFARILKASYYETFKNLVIINNGIYKKV